MKFNIIFLAILLFGGVNLSAMHQNAAGELPFQLVVPAPAQPDPLMIALQAELDAI